jgi:thiamine kinase-like enzyme
VATLDAILDRLQRRLGTIEGDLAPLGGGITNRNYRLRAAGRDLVLRLPGKDTDLLGISREAERRAGEAAAALGLAPAVVLAEPDFIVTEFVDAAPLHPGRLHADPEPMARALRRFHDCGVHLPVRFWVPDLLEDYAELVRRRGGSLPDGYEDARRMAHDIATALPLTEPVPCHDDLLPANLLGVAGRPQRVVLVDWEYAGMGHRLFDLGNLAVNNEFGGDAEQALLAAYLGAPPTPGQRAGLALMRLMSDAREGAWGAVQSVVSELDFDFTAYAERHFARLQAAIDAGAVKEWLGAAAA